MPPWGCWSSLAPRTPSRAQLGRARRRILSSPRSEAGDRCARSPAGLSWQGASPSPPHSLLLFCNWLQRIRHQQGQSGSGPEAAAGSGGEGLGGPGVLRGLCCQCLPQGDGTHGDGRAAPNKCPGPPPARKGGGSPSSGKGESQESREMSNSQLKQGGREEAAVGSALRLCQAQPHGKFGTLP